MPSRLEILVISRTGRAVSSAKCIFWDGEGGGLLFLMVFARFVPTDEDAFTCSSRKENYCAFNNMLTIKFKGWNRELTLKCKLKCFVKPMKDPLGVSPSKGNQGTTRGKENILLTSVGIEPTTSGLDLPLLCRLSYEVGQRKSGTI